MQLIQSSLGSCSEYLCTFNFLLIAYTHLHTPTTRTHHRYTYTPPLHLHTTTTPAHDRYTCAPPPHLHITVTPTYHHHYLHITTISTHHHHTYALPPYLHTNTTPTHHHHTYSSLHLLCVKVHQKCIHFRQSQNSKSNSTRPTNSLIQCRCGNHVSVYIYTHTNSHINSHTFTHTHILLNSSTLIPTITHSYRHPQTLIK